MPGKGRRLRRLLLLTTVGQLMVAMTAMCGDDVDVHGGVDGDGDDGDGGELRIPAFWK